MEARLRVQAEHQDTARRASRLRPLDPRSTDTFRRPYTGRVSAPLANDAAKMQANRTGIAPPVFPNVGVQEWYYRQLVAILRDMQADILPDIRAIWNDRPNVIVGDARQTRAEKLQAEMERWSTRWLSRVGKLSGRLSDKFADKSFTATNAALEQSFKKADLTVRFKPTRRSVEAYRAVAAENINLIKSIPAQYAKDVQSAVWDSVMRGGDLKTLTDNVRDKYGVGEKRARLIARDQNNKAKAVLERTRRMEMGITEAIWMHSSAGKEPRPTHVAMNGKRYEIADGMYDSDENEMVHPGELINCRCTSRAVLPGLDDDDQ